MLEEQMADGVEEFSSLKQFIRWIDDLMNAGFLSLQHKAAEIFRKDLCPAVDVFHLK